MLYLWERWGKALAYRPNGPAFETQPQDEQYIILSQLFRPNNLHLFSLLLAYLVYLHYNK